MGQSQMQMALCLLVGSTTARSGVLLWAGVLTSLSLHSSGRGRSYLRALIYDQVFFLDLCFSLVLELLPLCGCLEKNHPWSSCSGEFKQTDVVTIVCNKKKCDISFHVVHAFPIRDLFAYLPLVLILNDNVGKMGIMCWPFFSSHTGA